MPVHSASPALPEADYSGPLWETWTSQFPTCHWDALCEVWNLIFHEVHQNERNPRLIHGAQVSLLRMY